MKLLAVDTCLGACSVALLQGETVLAHRFESMERGHAERLAPMVQEAMAGHDFASLDRLAVTVGPGTFTGQRVGLAFMRGLRLALKKPLVGVTSLEVMVPAAQDELHFINVAVLHDARRGEVYIALVNDDFAVMPPRVMTFDDAIAAVRTFGPCVLAGTAAPAAKELLGDGFALSSIRQPDALFVARLAAKSPAPAPGTPPPAPLYLRAPDAKLPAQNLQTREAVTLFSGDAAPLAALHAVAFDKPWDADALRSLLAGPGVFAFAANCGFVLARAVADEAEILTLAVTPAARGRGLGRALMRAAASHAAALGAQSLFLEVGSDNPAALALYNGLGFQRAGQRKAYYGATSRAAGDALVLRLPLAGELA